MALQGGHRIRASLRRYAPASSSADQVDFPGFSRTGRARAVLGTLADRHQRSTRHVAAKAPSFRHSACPIAASQLRYRNPRCRHPQRLASTATTAFRVVRGSSPHFITASASPKGGRGIPSRGRAFVLRTEPWRKPSLGPWRASIPISGHSQLRLVRSAASCALPGAGLVPLAIPHQRYCRSPHRCLRPASLTVCGATSSSQISSLGHTMPSTRRRPANSPQNVLAEPHLELALAVSGETYNAVRAATE